MSAAEADKQPGNMQQKQVGLLEEENRVRAVS